MKRVLLVNTSETGYNGVASVIMNYVRQTHEIIKYDFVLCGRVEQKFSDELGTLGENIFIPPCSRVKHPIKYYKWIKALMVKYKYDCIHVHGNSGTMWFEIHAAKKAGVQVRIAHSHNTSCKHKFIHKILKPHLNRETTCAVACSKLAGRWLFNKEFTVLTNGIDVDRFAYSQEDRNRYREELNLQDKLVIGHVAIMVPEKNHLYLLKFFKHLLSQRNDARLVLIGNGRLRPEIEKYVNENNLTEYVQILGKRSDVAALYQSMDIFVLPSLHEGLPVTLVEAQAAGLPCIISENITREVDLTGKVQYLGISDADIDKWVDAILNTDTEPENRKGLFADVSASGFNINNCIQTLLSLYEG